VLPSELVKLGPQRVIEDQRDNLGQTTPLHLHLVLLQLLQDLGEGGRQRGMKWLWGHRALTPPSLPILTLRTSPQVLISVWGLGLPTWTFSISS
jgi:hypothetical protein